MHELWRDHRVEIFGEEIPDAPRFPIFAKLLDAQEKLSLQVHPGADAVGAALLRAKAKPRCGMPMGRGN